eukprot:gene5279-biopygen2327
MARHPRLNYATFQALDADQVFQLLQFEMAPSTPYEVINRLDRSVRFKLDDSKYRPSSRDYRPFYSALLTYIREFTMAYDLITGLLPADLIPKLSTKDLGILKVFLSKIPFEYGWRLHTAYLQDNVNARGPGSTSMASNSQSITNFHRYLSAFGQYVNQHFNVYRDCRTFEQFFGGTAYHGGTNTARPRHRTQHVNAIMPAPTLLSEDSSNSEDDSDPEPYPEDMVYPEQEDTLDDGNMYADTAETAFVPAAADSQLSLADARSQDDDFVDDPGSLNAIPSNTPIRSSDNAHTPFRGSQSPRPPTLPQRKLTGSSGRASSPSTSAHSTIHGYGHRRSSDTRYPATDKRKPRAATPPGVGPASGILQNAARELFADFSDWTISIFDNLLVLAHDYEDAYRKLELILDRCIERNVFLKFSKSWLGFDQAKFFGYIVRHRRYELDKERKDSITSIPFPTTLKKMQQFLGAAIFFRSFVPHFASLTAPLHDMTRQEFDWKHPDRWSQDYPKVFEGLKSALLEAHTLYLPDYSLEWILRTDASLLGVGAVLFQLFVSPDSDDPIYQPIAFVSHKFSAQASRWTTIEQEAFAIFYAVMKLSFQLRGKPFVLETDHNNLLWIEASVVPKIMRWRIFLQSFIFKLRHIPGKQNLLADYFSRMHDPSPVRLHFLKLMIS